MTTETTPDAVLNGILTCGQCGASMALKQDDNSGSSAYYTCSGWAGKNSAGCLTPDLDAKRLDELVFETVMKAVLTEKHTSVLVAKTDQLLAKKLADFQDCPSAMEDQVCTREEIRDMAASKDFMVQAAGSARVLRELLNRFIEEIRITPGNAAVHFSIPLPMDSPTSDEWVMNISLPADTMTCRLPAPR